MADLYITIKLGGSGDASDREYVDFANLLLTKFATDPDFQKMLKRGETFTNSLFPHVNVQGFDPIVLEGYVVPGCIKKPVNAIRPQDTLTKLTLQLAKLS
jgi:hypothetical protein